MRQMDQPFLRYAALETAPPTFCRNCAITPGGNEDDPEKLPKKIRVILMGVDTDPQTPEVIREKNVIMKHPSVTNLKGGIGL